MLYIGIDQHSKKITVSVRDESGSVVVRRQVSTEWTKVRAFLKELSERAAAHGGFLAIMEGRPSWITTARGMSAEAGVLLSSSSSSRSPAIPSYRHSLWPVPARSRRCCSSTDP